MYLQNLQTQITNILNTKFNIKSIIKYYDKDLSWDFYLPLFIYREQWNNDLLKIFNDFKEILLNLSVVSEVQLDNGFLNIKLQRGLISQKILSSIYKLSENYAQKEINNQVIILDYSSPNIAKNFSIGHLRSTIIGNALKNIYRKLGFITIGINHLGDWGTQFGQMILAYQKWGKEDLLLNNTIDELQKLYILFHEKAQNDTTLHLEAKNIFKKLEEKDEQIFKLWRLFRRISLKEFRKIYKLLGISFDFSIGESFYHQKALRLVKKLYQQKLIIFDQKAYIFPLKNTPSALIQKDNGSTLYLTRDMACLLYRIKKFNFQKMLYVVGNEQKLHYKQLIEIMKKMGYSFDIQHVNFGLICLNKIKISTRKHQDYKLIDIIHYAQKKIIKIIENRNKNLSKINISKVAEKIAIGAIVFNDLKNDRHLNIDFNLENMIKFEGNTGPYLQYTLVRLKSIISKIKCNIELDKLNWLFLTNYFQKDYYFIIVKLLDDFPVILEKIIQNNMPSLLARYLFKLSQHTNYLYEKEKILTSQFELQQGLVLLIKSICIVLEEGLKLLGIPIVIKM
ncbi:arginine--tRNA ligase [Candidatus Phytoplasma fabacearum]|uniref:arginine--tRNA ligase n=1 Tax=Candidatus Phytoplasma fabacearum TaxID=2982628 RepID=UPI002712EE9C|nr:arginine--tRNA ligase ['Bituminaria bituminosa' little leaf phytoplasma]MDV3154281.1 arginine--tRNA ligase [Pigeon pea little leaf phytoplasma]MDO7983646.1 arginine--tRNA ligase ['Bituminaria bituminosa' little leaf phytoplasma]MDO8030455.1 arginine--tRNA ligase ['Bituminaria bituminosa' little leaf phytoplasma]MDV3163426.1 arginine--tRNA ligase [Pigeon pea little leaf phytoplasma]MDV3164606.1 arginine--tRNA ligase [Pigeon pea little leaf phytoplasma]